MLSTTGTSSDNLDKSISEPLLNNSVSSLILDHPTFGSPPKNADSHPPAISINTTTHPRAPPMSTTEPTSTSPTAQEQSQDLLDKTQSGSPVLKLKMLFLPKSLPFTASLSSHPNSTVFWEWLGLPSPLTDFLLSLISSSSKARSKATLSLST